MKGSVMCYLCFFADALHSPKMAGQFPHCPTDFLSHGTRLLMLAHPTISTKSFQCVEQLTARQLKGSRSLRLVTPVCNPQQLKWQLPLFPTLLVLCWKAAIPVRFPTKRCERN